MNTRCAQDAKMEILAEAAGRDGFADEVVPGPWKFSARLQRVMGRSISDHLNQIRKPCGERYSKGNSRHQKDCFSVSPPPHGVVDIAHQAFSIKMC